MDSIVKDREDLMLVFSVILKRAPEDSHLLVAHFPVMP